MCCVTSVTRDKVRNSRESHITALKMAKIGAETNRENTEKGRALRKRRPLNKRMASNREEMTNLKEEERGYERNDKLLR